MSSSIFHHPASTENIKKENSKRNGNKPSKFIEPDYFENHTCELKPEQVSQYELKCGVFMHYLMYLTRACAWDSRTRSMFRSYAALFAEVNRHYKTLPFIIHPFSRLRLAMEIFVVINYHICIIAITLYTHELTFNPYYHYTVEAAELAYIAFILSNFFTGYEAGTTSKYVVLDLKKIAWRYLTSWFIVDVLYCFGLFIYQEGWFGTYSLKIDIIIFSTKLLRLPTILAFSNNVMLRLGASETLKTYLHITILLCNYIIWNVFFQDCIEDAIENTMQPVNPRACSWPTISGIWNASVAERRAFSFNRAVNMLRRSGDAELMKAGACVGTFQLVAWIIAFLVCFHCGAKFLILKIGEESAYARFFKMVNQVKVCMEQHRLPKRLIQKALNYYAIRFNSFFFSEWKMMRCMTPQLREAIIIHTTRRMVKEVEFLEKLPRNLLLKIGTKLQIVLFLAGDIIMKINTLADCMYFIDKGTIAVYSESGMEITHMQDGEYFGEVELAIPLQYRLATVVAVTNCELFRLDKAGFDATIACYPTVYEDMKKAAVMRREAYKIIDERHKTERRLLDDEEDYEEMDKTLSD